MISAVFARPRAAAMRRFVERCRLALAVAALLSCGGCLVGPDFSAPAAPFADKWLETTDPSVDTGRQEYRDWWTSFHDPILNRLVEVAYNQNLSLVSAGRGEVAPFI